MEAKPSVLVVEDDADFSEVVSSYLRLHGYTCVQAYSGSEAALRCLESAASAFQFDIVVCDLMLPGLSGEEFIARLREKSNVPVIVMSAKGALTDKVGLLRMGADDYLVKPFELEELLARVEARLRRGAQNSPAPDDGAGLSFGRWYLNPSSREFLIDGTALRLTRTEFEILELLAELLASHPGPVFTRSEIANAAHGDDIGRTDKTADAHIANIRGKLRRSDTDAYIATVWGIGFRLALP